MPGSTLCHDRQCPTAGRQDDRLGRGTGPGPRTGGGDVDSWGRETYSRASAPSPRTARSRASYSSTDLRGLYRALLTSRLIEEKMLVLVRQGRLTKWFSGIGQEAVSVGS